MPSLYFSFFCSSFFMLCFLLFATLLCSVCHKMVSEHQLSPPFTLIHIMARGNKSNSSNQNNNNPFQTLNPSNESLASIDNIHSHYFQHSGDHSGLILVTYSLVCLNDNTQNRSMHMALNAKNKLGFADGSLNHPAAEYPTASIWSRAIPW